MNSRADSLNAKESQYWNGDAGEHWVRQADGLDFVLHEVGDAMLARAGLQPGDRVLDVGCGSGAVTLAAQNLVATLGTTIGLDISHPLILKAQQRAEERNSRATFVVGDAATWRAEIEFDSVLSRLGVMFFDDPVAAFTHIRSLSKPGGRLTFACWCSPKESDLGTGLMSAVASLFTKPVTPPDPTAPGPYALADRRRTTSILSAAGWSEISIERWEGRLPLPGSTLHENAQFAARLGSLGRLMREQNVPVERVTDALMPFLEQRIESGRAVLRGAAWLVTARRS